MEPSSPLQAQAPAAEPPATVAEDLPTLYRAILERVAGLERAGARAEAARIRHEATQAYSSAWDEAARRMLVTLLLRADRTTTPPVRTRAWSCCLATKRDASASRRSIRARPVT